MSEFTVAEQLPTAIRLFSAGQLDDAERLFARVLEIAPENPEALDHLARLAIGRNQLDVADKLLERAIAASPSCAENYVNRGEVVRRQGDLVRAAELTLRAMALQPKLVAAHSNLGLIRSQQGNPAAAAECFGQAVALKPGDAALECQLGVALFQLGQLEGAVECLQRAINLEPSDPRPHFQLAVVLNAMGQVNGAINAYRTVLQLNPQHTESHNNLGSIYRRLQDLSQAEGHFRQALQIMPDHVMALSNLGAVLAEKARYEEALQFLGRAIDLRPDLSATLCNAGFCLERLGQLDDAIEVLQQSIAVNPQSASAHINLGNCARKQGRAAEAIVAYRNALAIDPNSSSGHSNLVYTLNLAPADPQAVFDEHLRWAAQHAEPITARATPHANDRTFPRRLRLGYVSDQFRAHAVNYFSEPLIQSHDHQAFEVFCYSTVHANLCDATTARLRGYSDQWRDVSNYADQDLANLIRGDRIDILVDLVGHIAGNRLLAFAHKPAPVQVTYLGYQNTTGMSAFDYRLTDAWSDPLGVTDRYYTEKLVRLPETFFCYQPLADSPPVEPPPSLVQGHVTFGSFNNFAKVTPQVLATWAEILNQVPDSRLLILATDSQGLKKHITRMLGKSGIAPERFEIHGQMEPLEFLAFHGRVDIGLDPFPFNGHTTTCDALWMGVPVVMMAGESYASRFGSSALVNLKLEDLVARSTRQYVQVAVELAGNKDRLRQLRGDLRSMMHDSPITDARRFTTNVETAYLQMWTTWLDRQR